MKLAKIAAIGVAAVLFASCGVSDRHDDIKDLNKKEKWDEDQVNQAIDYYIEGVDEACSRLEDVMLVQEKLYLEYMIKSYGDKDVLKERKQEIKEAEKASKQAAKEVKKKYKNKNSDSIDDNDGYGEYEDYE